MNQPQQGLRAWYKTFYFSPAGSRTPASWALGKLGDCRIARTGVALRTWGRPEPSNSPRPGLGGIGNPRAQLLCCSWRLGQQQQQQVSRGVYVRLSNPKFPHHSAHSNPHGHGGSCPREISPWPCGSLQLSGCTCPVLDLPHCSLLVIFIDQETLTSSARPHPSSLGC